jgi:hypothetical protein
MSSFFDNLRHPGKPTAPFELADLQKETADLSAELATAWDASVFRDETRNQLIELLTDSVYAKLDLDSPDPRAILAMIYDIIADEPLLSARPLGVTGLDYKALLLERARLVQLRTTLADPEPALECLVDTVSGVFARIFHGLPSLGDGIQFETRLIDAKADVPETIDTIYAWLSQQHDALAKHDLLLAWRKQLSQNAYRIAGVLENAPQRDFDRAFKLASEQRAQPEQLIANYLTGLPFAAAFELPWSISISTKLRFEHTHVCATSGAGKTNLYGEMILHDLQQVALGKASVVVLDHSGRFIEEHLVKLKQFAATEPLHDRLVYIDPTDVDFPVQLNIFARTGGNATLSPYQRDREVNKLVSLLNFIFAALDQGATGRQKTMLQAVAHIMLAIPGAGLKELNQLFKPLTKSKSDPLEPFYLHLVQLEEHMQQFCREQFNSPQFAATRDQIAPRIQSLIVDSTLYRMFSAPEQKLDLAHELDRGTAVFINCKKDFLEDNTQIFGRFFIALLRQAINARADYPEEKLMPTFVYIDEAHTWIKDDPNVQDILETARKFKVGILLAHQALYQMGDKVTSALQMTSIKMAAKLTEQDLRSMAGQLRTTNEFIRARPTHSFALWMAGMPTAAAITVPVGRLHAAPKMTDAEFAEVRYLMRRKYATSCTPADPFAAAEPMNEPMATETPITSSLPSSAHGASPAAGPHHDVSQPDDDINTTPSTLWRRPPPK